MDETKSVSGFCAASCKTPTSISSAARFHRFPIFRREAMSFDWKSLPIRESVGVLLGVLGVDWLVTGHADPLLALALAAVTGAMIMILRRLTSRRKID